MIVTSLSAPPTPIFPATGVRSRWIRATSSTCLSVLAEGLPKIKLTEDDIASSFAGLRALVISGDEKSPSAVPREETIIESASGMLSVAGGKLTTHREIAEKVVNRLMTKLGRNVAASPTRTEPLPGARQFDGGDKSYVGFTGEEAEFLEARYGTRVRRSSASSAGAARIRDAARAGLPRDRRRGYSRDSQRDGAMVADFLVRRTSLIWRYPIEAEAAAPAVARIMASELGWDSAREEAELSGFVNDLKRRRAAGRRRAA